MGIFRRLLSSHSVSLAELKKALSGLERERRRRSLRVRKLEGRRVDLVERLRKARSDGRSLDVDYAWEDLKQLNAESAIAYREARISSLEALGLKRYIHGLERLQARNDESGARMLLERVRRSGLDDKLTGQAIRDDEYLSELEAILDDVGAELSPSAGGDEDPEKAAFLAEIDAINDAEKKGQVERARERESNLNRRLRQQAESGEMT
jgi:hypothetical protein